jgi:DMSO/TMAO reductase YedYZ molybdopterin-dependent catalytic subunit
MVLSPLHYVPSAIAALLVLILIFNRGRAHRATAMAMIFAATLGLLGYIRSGNLSLYPLDFHATHSWLGLAAFLLSTLILFDRILLHEISPSRHCAVGYAAALLAALSLLTGLIILTGQIPEEHEAYASLQETASSNLPETEAKEYLGIMLTPLSQQGNNAISGTQNIDPSAYRLKVTGLVERNLSFSHDELLALPAYSEVAYMPCVEGWGFFAKWTGFKASDLLNVSGLKPSARYVVFRSEEGYSTGLPLDYLRDEKILMAYGINDVTIPPERGYPLQLVARGRYGYKWAKWITEIEVMDGESKGYWESRGYSNSAKVGELPFG